jgi:hypothetical protein
MTEISGLFQKSRKTGWRSEIRIDIQQSFRDITLVKQSYFQDHSEQGWNLGRPRRY